MCYAAENTKPHRVWERHLLLEFILECLTTMGELLAPLGEGKLFSLYWDPFVLLQAGPVQTHYI